jgi:hypothetical protein
LEKASGIWVFVPDYRCGAVPDSHRIPFTRYAGARPASFEKIKHTVSEVNLNGVGFCVENFIFFSERSLKRFFRKW